MTEVAAQAPVAPPGLSPRVATDGSDAASPGTPALPGALAAAETPESPPAAPGTTASTAAAAQLGDAQAQPAQGPPPAAATQPGPVPTDVFATGLTEQGELDPALVTGTATEAALEVQTTGLAADEGTAASARVEPGTVQARDAALHEARLEQAAAGIESASGRPSPDAIARAERILNQVRVQLRPELSQAVVELDPESLGRISIKVEVEDGGVSARIRAERPETLAALERHLPELRAMFQQSGVDVSDLDLSLGFAADDNAGFGDQDAPRGGDAHLHPHDETNDPHVEPALVAQLSELGVDTYA